MGGVAGLGAGVLVTMKVAALILPAAMFAPVVAIGGLAVGLWCLEKTIEHVKAVKTESIPALKQDIAARYMKLKAEQFRQAWADNVQKKKLEKEAKAAAPKVEQKKPEPGRTRRRQDRCAETRQRE